MGGRGIHIDDHNSQISLEQYLFSREIAEIHSLKERLRKDAHIGIGQGTNSSAAQSKPGALKRCACCRQYSIPAFTEYETCPVCGWIDDPNQKRDPELKEGANPISLSEARQRWGERNKK